MTHTHFMFTDDPNLFRVFDIDECERCGCDVEAVNAVNVEMDEQTLLVLGKVCLSERLSELYHNDIFGGAVCDRCDNELAEQEYQDEEEVKHLEKAACVRCEGWTNFGGMSQHSKSKVEVLGRVGCSCYSF